MSERTTKRWKSVTIAALLFLVFCSSGFFAGFRYGKSAGTDERVEQLLKEREEAERSLTITRVYALSDLVKYESIEGLSEGITKSVPRYNQADGRSMVATGKDSIIISATPVEHDAVVAYLEGRRDQLKAIAEATAQVTE